MSESKPPMWERDPDRYREKAKERIRKHSVVDPDSECWVWIGALRGGVAAGCGYHESNIYRARPQIGYKGSPAAVAYRVAYELWVGPIPEGLGIDHLCEHRLCVNPDHLEPVTTQENNRRYWERKRGREDAKLRHPAFQDAK